MTRKQCYGCKYLKVDMIKGKEEYICSRYNVRVQNVPNCILSDTAKTKSN